ncbi:neuroglian isoform X2 [Octopus sinensis]|uniref:Neuroglian isoform X2 n=1 Tax=Octopus sinensis TaxID=2607531 RepID=A0A6P7SDI2_9MOLL|nr:neuroglian isoform X2 [Octopus sinensis]
MVSRKSTFVICLILLVFSQVISSSYISTKITKYQNENNLSEHSDIQIVPLTAESNLPPSITEQPNKIGFIHSKQPLELPCMATGKPAPEYTWYKNGKKIDLNSTEYKGRITQLVGVGSILFHSPSLEDIGGYQCAAASKLGKSLSIITRLYMAELTPFLKKATTHLAPMMGESVKLVCIPPKGTPKPTISWSILERKTNAMKQIKLDNRISMDYEGNLYFANVRQHDYQDGNNYMCSANMFFLRIFGQGFDHVIKPEAVSQGSIKKPVEILWVSKTDIKVLRTDDLKMKCIFSGNPTPTVVWKRLNGEIDIERTEDGIDNLELVIKNVDFDDAGEYQCIGDNEVTNGQISKKFKVTVASRPYWVTDPEDVTKGVDENVTFSCQALGRPKPDVKWYINGEPIESVPPRVNQQFQNDTLKYFMLTRNDSKVIQCNASNENGYLWADFYLNVLAIPPSFMQGVPELTKVAAESVVVLPCIAEGKPTPAITWFRGDQLIKSDRHEMLPGGALKITGVQATDSGEYTCRAKNKFGEMSSTGKLAVRKRTSIVEGPDDMVVMVGKTALFTCYAITDSYEIDNLKISWYKDSVPVDVNDPNIKHEESNNLIISNLSNKDSGNYTCVASNGLDNATKGAELKVKGPPDPPIDVKVDCEPESATIAWKEGKDNYSPITHYIIEFKTSFDDAWYEKGKTDDKVEKWETELTSWSNFTFRVKGVNELGTGAPSEPADNVCSTAADFPPFHPRNVRTLINKKDYLVVVWDPMSPLQFNGPGFYYEVKIEKDDKVETYTVDGNEEAKKEIRTNTTYEPYTITVAAKNDKGYAKNELEEIEGYSGEDAPLEVPGNFEVDPDHEMTATSARFRWDPVNTDKEKMRGVFKGYRILFWKPGEKETTLKKIDVSENTHNRRSTRRSRHRRTSSKVKANVMLPAYSNFSLSVVARNTYYEGPESNVIDVQTPEGAPGKVHSFMALVRGSGHFHLKWEPPEERNGVLIGYNIGFQKINGLKVSPVKYEDEPTTDPTMTEYILRGLEASTNYRIQIQAMTTAGEGEPYYIDVWTTDAGMPIVPDWNMIPMGNNSLNVSWKIDYNKTNQHVGLMHVVEYRKLGESNLKSTPGQMLNRWQNISNLSAGIWYEFRVVAKSGERQAASSWKKITLPKPAHPSIMFKGTATQDLTSATWFIAMMVAIALLILILIIVCIAKRNHEAKYDVQEEERLRGHDPYSTDDHPNDSKNDENGIGKPGALVNGDKTSGISDSDSLGDYGDVDPSKFNEDGSFIGQYGTQDKKEATETAAPSAMSTFV